MSVVDDHGMEVVSSSRPHCQVEVIYVHLPVAQGSDTWPNGTKETHSGHFASNSVELGDRNRVQDAGYHLKAAIHGDEECTIEAAHGELYKGFDIFRTSTSWAASRQSSLTSNSCRCSARRRSSLIDSERVRLQVRHIDQGTICIRLTVIIPMYSRWEGLTCLRGRRRDGEIETGSKSKTSPACLS